MLNFDPHRWIAERRRMQSVASFATVARVRPETVNSLPRESNATTATTATLRNWGDRLGLLHPSQPPAGFAPDRWQALVADALWLSALHGESAAALGWSESDLFGLDDSLDGWGGLADRLRGARRVHLTARVGHWRSDDEDGWLWRTTLRPMRTIWEFVA